MSIKRRLFQLGIGRPDPEEGVQWEVEHHLDEQVDRLLEEGWGEDQARREAERRFGDLDYYRKKMERIEKRRHFGEVVGCAASSLVQDLRVASRVLAGERVFTLVILATLALAISANTAIFSVVEGVLLRPLPYPEAENLVHVAAATEREVSGKWEAPFSDRGYWHFFNNNRSFEHFGAYAPPLQWPLLGQGQPVQIDVARMTHSTFQLLGIPPRLGRLPSEAEDLPGGPRVALLGERLWEGAFGSDPSIIGKTVSLAGVPFEVIGVMPRDYEFPDPETDLWTPRQLDPSEGNYSLHHLLGVAKLKEDVSIQAAKADGETLIAGFREIGYGPEWFEGGFSGQVNIVSFHDQMVGKARTPLLILFGSVAFVLLIACSNVANLLLVRAEKRTQELAVRMALGSGRTRLVRYVVLESVLLGLFGGILGAGLALVGVRALVSMGPGEIPRLETIGINWTVLFYVTALSLLSSLIFSVFPAVRAGSIRWVPALKNGGPRNTGRRERMNIRSTLVVVQVAMAILLLAGSGLMVRSYRALQAVDAGMEPAGVLTFRLSPSSSRYDMGEQTARFYDQVVEELEAVPGVIVASGIDYLPMNGNGPTQLPLIHDFPPEEGELGQSVEARRVIPGYFEALQIPVIEGRSITAEDHRSRLGSLMISKSLKDQFWPSESALGKEITFGRATGQVVGVVGDVHHRDLRSPVEQFVYKPMLDSEGGGVRGMTMVVRATGDPSALVPGIRQAIGRIDPDLPVSDVRTLQEIVGASTSHLTFTMALLLLAALFGMFLGSVGIFGVLSYVAAQRTAETGIRMALGAETRTILKSFLAQGLSLTAIGIVVGLGGAIVLTGALRSLLFGVTPLDPITLGCTVVIFLIIATVASLIPAQRAARTHPVVALRGD